MKTPYVPALRFRFLTRWFDALVSATTKEEKIRETVVRLAEPGPGRRVLDVGSGTGTQALLLAERNPEGTVEGIDLDPDILEIARAKARRLGIPVAFREASADRLPFEEGRFDSVVSSLVFHHLPPESKKAAFREILRVLKPGGRFVLADWGRPRSPIERLNFYCVQLLDGFATTTDNVRGRLPHLALEAGFSEFPEVARERTIYGILSFHVGRKA